MNQELGFETIPFEITPEFQSETFEGESEKGRSRPFPGGANRSFRPSSRPGLRPKGTKPPPIPRPRPIPRSPRRPWEVIREPYGPVSEPYPVEPEPSYGSERVRWVQDCLNQTLGLQLPVSGVMGPETRSAVRSFQQQQGLRVSGIVGPNTEQALGSACRPGPAQAAAGDQVTDEGPRVSEGNYEADPEFGDFFGRIASGLGSAYDRVADAVGGATGSRIIDLTAKSEKSHRKGNRDPKTVYALVLHQMACCAMRKDPLRSYLKTKSHFAILRDGAILQLHPISDLIWASNGFNARSVAVEFAGNFPNTHGKWWVSPTYKAGRDRPTQAQFEAGRYLVRYLMQTMALTHVLAHRQSSGTRENDPGPDIWSQVGQWAVDKLGLKDGGPGFKIGSGNPIPDAWRKWKSPSVTPEIGPKFEGELLEQEIAHDVAQGEAYSGSDHEFGENRTGAGIVGKRLDMNRRVAPSYRSGNEAQHHEGKIMHNLNCNCSKCQTARQFEWAESEFPTFAEVYGETAFESPFSEAEEIALAAELLSISSEEELDQFLGKLFKGVWKGIKKVGSFVGKIAKPLGGILKGVAKAALPLVGGVLGSFIPIPGVGTALGSALGGALSKALELEFGEFEQEEQELEMARRFVRIAGTAARQAALADPDADLQQEVQAAVMAAARQHVPNLSASVTGAGLTASNATGYARTGRWVRQGRAIVVLGA